MKQCTQPNVHNDFLSDYRSMGKWKVKSGFTEVRRAVFVFAVGLCLGLLLAEKVCAMPQPENVFYDMPQNLLVNPVPAPTAAQLAVNGYPNDPARLTLAAQVFKPDANIHGDGPYPTVIVIHGSGGLWSNDIIADGMASQFDDWAEVLTDAGFLCIFPDSFNPRGILGNFQSKRPHYDPTKDDALCSPNYERPKDVVATLAYLVTRGDVDQEHIGMLGFSHGSQMGLNAILDPSVNQSPYTVSYVPDPLANPPEDDELQVPDPVRIPNSLPFPKVCSFYYPGCGHYSYHGSSSATVAGRYMPDRRTKVLMFHGTEDSLLGVDDVNANPLEGNLYPIKFVLKSESQALVEGISNPFKHHIIFDQVEHSFDNETIEPPQNWNTQAEDINEKAKRLARDETMKWFRYLLQPAKLEIVQEGNNPDDFKLSWHGHDQLNYQLKHSVDLQNWGDFGNQVIGAGGEMNVVTDGGVNAPNFYRLSHWPVEPPINALENVGFFRVYADFDW